MVVVEIAPGAIDAGRLAQAQANATKGLYAAAMAAYLRWLAPRLDSVRATAVARVEDLARQFTSTEAHRRSARAAGELLHGLWLFLSFAREVGALSQAGLDSLWSRVVASMGEVIQLQVENQRSESPVDAFLAVLQGALVSGQAHVAAMDGGMPERAEALGWRFSGDVLRPNGSRIGWTDGESLYLESKAALMVARRVDPKAVSLAEDTLVKRLFEAGLLAATDERGKKTRYRVRRSFGGARVAVLQLLLASVIEIDHETKDLGPPEFPLPPGGPGVYAIDNPTGGA